MSRASKLAAGSSSPAAGSSSPPSGTPSPTAGGNVVSGGTFTLGMSADPGNLDPQASAGSNTFQISQFAYDHLLNEDAAGKIQSGLASTWKIDGPKIVLALHKAIGCSDGSPFTAADAAANINYVADPKSKSPFLGVYLPVGSKASADTSAGTVTMTAPKAAPFVLNGLSNLPMVCAEGMKNRKTLATQTGVISVLHSRGAEVSELSWTTDRAGQEATLTMTVEIAPSRQRHLREALNRLISVTSVEVVP